MPRKLKTYVATSGFFELAVAAPTKKAALEIWGAGPDLFQRGYAKETGDSAIVKATMAKPGMVLQRAVGSPGAFKEHAELPDVSTWEKSVNKPAAPKAPAPKLERVNRKAVAAADRKATQLYEAAQKKRGREKARAEERERRRRERREQAIRKAESQLQTAREAHDKRAAAIEQRRADVERIAREEDAHWRREEQRLKTALRDARG